MSVSFEQENLEALRVRLRKMSDADLLRFGKAARYMCSPQANGNNAPRPEFVLQLKEARAEWRRRHPKEQTGDNIP